MVRIPHCVLVQVFWEVLITVLSKGTSYVDTLKNIISAYRDNGTIATTECKTQIIRSIAVMVLHVVCIYQCHDTTIT